MLVIPEASHIIVKPWERLTSQQNAEDWFRFWLQDYERTEPVTAAGETKESLEAQYARWRGLKKLQAVNDAKSAATRLN